MFTGIIQSTSSIQSLTSHKEMLSVGIVTPQWWDIVLGESISINGICSTVCESNETTFTVQYMPETLRNTTSPNWRERGILNLEKSIKAGQSLDGHFVLGHIDTVGTIVQIRSEGESRIISITIAAEYRRYIVYKGSITLDGISLTVSSVSEKHFEVSMIPYTLTHTNFSMLKVYDWVNIETDILAKYVTSHL